MGGYNHPDFLESYRDREGSSWSASIQAASHHIEIQHCVSIFEFSSNLPRILMLKSQRFSEHGVRICERFRISVRLIIVIIGVIIATHELTVELILNPQ